MAKPAEFHTEAEKKKAEALIFLALGYDRLNCILKGLASVGEAAETITDIQNWEREARNFGATDGQLEATRDVWLGL